MPAQGREEGLSSVLFFPSSQAVVTTVLPSGARPSCQEGAGSCREGLVAALLCCCEVLAQHVFNRER